MKVYAIKRGVTPAEIGQMLYQHMTGNRGDRYITRYQLTASTGEEIILWDVFKMEGDEITVSTKGLFKTSRDGDPAEGTLLLEYFEDGGCGGTLTIK